MAAGVLALQAGIARADEPTLQTGRSDTASAIEDVRPLAGKDAYRAIFAALRASNWAEAKSRILLLDKNDPVRAVALSELYTAKNSPRVELFDLLALLNTANWLPDTDQLGRMAQKRGAELIPDGPQTRKLMYLGAAPKRRYITPTREDTAAQALVAQILPYIKNDDPAGAEALLAPAEPGLSPDGIAEVRQRVAWSYYIENDDAGARRLASRALESGSGGDWAVQAHWTIGLSAWRQNDLRGAAASFEQVAGRASNEDMRSAGAYWAARAWMNAGQPARVQSLLRLAARSADSFYGMLARETLGITAPAPAANPLLSAEIADRPAVRAAVSLHEIGEDGFADELLRRQAEIGDAREFDALLSLTDTLNLPETQLWLAHHGPAGHEPDSFARFPMPKWAPDGGWRVDPALVFAHTLQESNFRARAVSPAGARGLMQVMPGTAKLVSGSPDQLFNPSTNMEYGQRYLEQLRDSSATGGLLPKVMAAYNAGPAPVARWATEVRDGGDPLLFMESLPYYETRAYVNIVMRNYWMYELREDGKADALTAMAEGKWPAFPTMKNGKTVAMSYRMKR
ncbi:MAG: transglycosylase SLT domain-containing protein [Sphingobium sp.]